MSKVDAGNIERSALREMQQAEQAAQKDTHKSANAEQILAAFMRMIEREKVSASPLMKMDLSASTAQLRDIMAQEMTKILQQIPGFVAPQLSRPPTPDEIKQLLKTMAAAEQSGLLEKHDAFKMGTAETARGTLLNPDSSPIAKQWSQFVQQTTQLQQPLLRKEGDVSPRELMEQEIPLRDSGAGLRSPVQVGDPFKALTNKQKLDIMSNGFGRELAMALKDQGVRDPLALLKQLATPQQREALAKSLGMTRGQLTVHVARAELLSIGAGRHGEQALRPQHLPALSQSNIVTLKQLGAVHSLSSDQLNAVFQQVRQNYSGFARAMSGERPILKKDLQHWAKSAAKRKSSLLDADWEDMPRQNGDAEEMIMAWYLQHWDELENKKKVTKEDLLKDAELPMPNTRHDPARDDGLICFWIERPNYDVNRPTLTEMVYVCLDPKTGLIDMKQKE